ncbi:MAG: di-trans,poly-cis-decaprenylcistransferase [Clostridia bacterium]|nr:di-trans,poly-cis-decaprenylcistransferase [Clostridia bacterium]
MNKIYNTPLHVAIIMDGNGRWAKNKGKPRCVGHVEGAKNVNKIVSFAFDSGVKNLTLYAFSTENWQRPQEEISTIFSALENYFNNFASSTANGKIRLRVLGERNNLPKTLLTAIENCENQTKDFTQFNLNIAINYGGRQEIVSAVKSLISVGEEITEESIANALYTAELPNPDLIIRTGGEKRLSNFLIYQSAYAELYFTDVSWPDFTEEDFSLALKDYKNRNRRYGGV